MPHQRPTGWTASAILIGLFLSACGQDNKYVPPPPAKVTVATPTKQPVTDYLEATGNTAAVNATDLVARVPGFVAEIKYQDGALVTKGQMSFAARTPGDFAKTPVPERLLDVITTLPAPRFDVQV